MTGKTHLTFGVGTGIVAASVLNPDSTLLGLGIIGMTAIGSLAPDIDSRTSKISKKMKITSVVISKMFGHRGFIHSPICVLLAFFIGNAFIKYCNLSEYSYLLYGYLIGYSGHLFLDMLTKGGIPLLYPFKTKKYHLTNFKTGGKAETFLFISTCILSVLSFVVYMIYGDIIKENALSAVNNLMFWT